MSLSEAPPNVAEFNLCWKQWVDIIALFADRRRGWNAVDPLAYESIYHRLIEGCHETVPAGLRFDRQKAADLVRPWLTLGSLAMADRDLLLDLVKRAGAIDGRHRRRSRSLREMAPMMILVAVVSSVVGLALAGPGPLAFLTPYWMAIELTFPQVAVALFVLGLIWLITRPPRN